jgi:hypothetical protein
MLPAMLPRRSTSHELQLQRELDGLRTMICRLRRELETKQGVVGRLETLVHERDERVDELSAWLEQSRQQVRRLDLQNEILIEMIAAPPLDAAMLAPK